MAILVGMKTDSESAIKQLLQIYLEQNNFRKTPERFAVIESVCSFDSIFTIQDLSDRLVERNFPVSRGTLYNTMRILIGLHIVESLKIKGMASYKVCYSHNRCYRICTVCGKVCEVKMPEVVKAMEALHIKRFRKENFSINMYGVCSTCQAVMTRWKKKHK